MRGALVRLGHFLAPVKGAPSKFWTSIIKFSLVLTIVQNFTPVGPHISEISRCKINKKKTSCVKHKSFRKLSFSGRLIKRIYTYLIIRRPKNSKTCFLFTSLLGEWVIPEYEYGCSPIHAVIRGCWYVVSPSATVSWCHGNVFISSSNTDSHSPAAINPGIKRSLPTNDRYQLKT